VRERFPRESNAREAPTSFYEIHLRQATQRRTVESEVRRSLPTALFIYRDLSRALAARSA